MIVTESEKPFLEFTGRVFTIWTVETFFNSIAGATWGFFSEHNSASFLKLLGECLLMYALVKAVFHLFPYWIAHRFLAFPNSPIVHFVIAQVVLFIFISFIAGSIFAWNLFYNDAYLAVAMVVSSAIAAFLFTYFEKKYKIGRV